MLAEGCGSVCSGRRHNDTSLNQNTTMKNTTLLKSYEVHCRMPLTTEARNAGATGRTYWWAFVDFVSARNKHHACAKVRQLAPAHADKLQAFSR
jgi:hypothetical protein